MKTYKIRLTATNAYAVYAVTTYGETRVKVFKTEQGAKNWIKKHS